LTEGRVGVIDGVYKLRRQKISLGEGAGVKKGKDEGSAGLAQFVGEDV